MSFLGFISCTTILIVVVFILLTVGLPVVLVIKLCKATIKYIERKKKYYLTKSLIGLNEQILKSENENERVSGNGYVKKIGENSYIMKIGNDDIVDEQIYKLYELMKKDIVMSMNSIRGVELHSLGRNEYEIEIKENEDEKEVIKEAVNYFFN